MSTCPSPFESGMLTRTTLLDALHDPTNQWAWHLVVNRYRPRLLGFAARMGLGPPDAEDAAQIVLIEFMNSCTAGAYDRSRGRLGHWLFGIARRQFANCKRRLPREHPPCRDTRTTAFFDRFPAHPGSSVSGRAAHDAELIQRCLEIVRDEVSAQTMDAFHLFAVLGRPAQDVARDLGMTDNAVFGAKRRVLHRIREIAATLESGL